MRKSFAFRFTTLVAGTWLGAWLSVHLQFGLSGYWGFASDEVEVVLLTLAVSLAAVALLFLPVSLAAERIAPSRWVKAAVVVSATIASICLGLLIYTVFLHRPLMLMVERDWKLVMCFIIPGIGYALPRVMLPRS